MKKTYLAAKKVRARLASTNEEPVVGLSILSLSGFRICHIYRSKLEAVTLSRQKRSKKLNLS